MKKARVLRALSDALSGAETKKPAHGGLDCFLGMGLSIAPDLERLKRAEVVGRRLVPINAFDVGV